MHGEERLKSPTRRRTKRNDKRDTDDTTRRSALAPALEHRDYSNEEQEDRSGRKRFGQHVHSLLCLETDMHAFRRKVHTSRW